MQDNLDVPCSEFYIGGVAFDLSWIIAMPTPWNTLCIISMISQCHGIRLVSEIEVGLVTDFIW